MTPRQVLQQAEQSIADADHALARAHGQRPTYKAGCRCTPCRASEAVYRRGLRTLKAHGRTPLGALISAVDAQRKIRQLKAERLSKAQLAGRLGLKCGKLRWHPERIRMKSALRLHRVYRELMLEGSDLPVDVASL